MTQQTQVKKALDEYFEALARLKMGRPVRVIKGTKITNDAVALEAGRGKGSIKKSRPAFTDLIQEIDAAAADQASGSIEQQQKEKLDKVRGTSKQYRNDLEMVLAREVSLLYELHESKKTVLALKKQVQELTERLTQVSSTKVQPIKPKRV